MYKSIMAFVLFTLSTTSTLVSAEPLDQLIEQLTVHEAFTANFRQITLSDDGVSINEVMGSLDLKHPDLFYWRAQAPQEQEVISNGETLWVYDIDLEQVTIQHVAENLNQSPAVILSGNRRLIDLQYNVTLLNQTDGLYTFRLMPKTTEASLLFMDIEVDQGIIQLLRFEDSLGQTTLISLFDFNVNPKFDQAHFRFIAPLGVDVLDQR